MISNPNLVDNLNISKTKSYSPKKSIPILIIIVNLNIETLADLIMFSLSFLSTQFIFFFKNEI